MAEHGYILSGLRKAPREIIRILKEIPDLLESEPMAPGEWSVHQILVHIQSVNEQVYFPRLRSILEQDNPVFQDFDADQWMRAHYDPSLPQDGILRQIAGQCEEMAGWLETLEDADWERPGTHIVLGTHPLEWWADRMETHLMEHLAQLRGE
jgi:hypothetical protein